MDVTKGMLVFDGSEPLALPQWLTITHETFPSGDPSLYNYRVQATHSLLADDAEQKMSNTLTMGCDPIMFTNRRSLSEPDLPDIVMRHSPTLRAANPAMKLEEELKVAQVLVPKYSGDANKEMISSKTWLSIFLQKMQKMCSSFDQCYAQAAPLELLTGQAFECLQSADFNTMDAMVEHLCSMFKHPHFQLVLIEYVQLGEAFAGCMRDNVIMWLKHILHELGNHIGGHVSLAQATEAMFPTEWHMQKVDLQNLSTEQYQGALLAIADDLAIHHNVTPKLFSKAKVTEGKASMAQLDVAKPAKDTGIADGGPSCSQHHKAARKMCNKALEEENVKL
ncbi:hypothetical protein H4R20_002105 [Coemansia guatemalensis]|uniref:Uncharacterized protein n=1 Tax=Coemansia guatemalensis TaxID=2761395 RepID=A0A9W8HY89_9FUNG|nr:hypothetical protein H4R20_002105 [Coemansia guatemalensis]